MYSNLWNNDAFFGSPPVNAVLSAVYAPPRDGAASVVLACLAPFPGTASAAAGAGASASSASGAGAGVGWGGACGGDTSNTRGGGAASAAAYAAASATVASPSAPAAAAADDDDLRFRYYARGLFASTFVARCAPANRGGVGCTAAECS